MAKERCAARCTGSMLRKFSTPSIARRVTISTVARRPCRSRAGGARGRGCTGIAGRSSAPSRSRTATTAGLARPVTTRDLEEGRMALTAAELVKADQEHLIHPLHHPSENAEPVIYVRGRGATVWDIGGHEYIDGLSGLWNVNVGHGRAELAEAAAAQMKELAYFTAYVGSSNIPAITLADRLMEITYDNMQAVFLASGGAEANESAFKTARFYWKAVG